MKNVLSHITCLFLIASCGSHKASSELSSAVALPMKNAYVFSRDLRPADGALVELKVTRNATDKNYSIVLDTTTLRSNKSTQDFGNKFICSQTTIHAGSAISGLSCSNDRRPVDGGLSVIEVQGHGDPLLFDATHTTTFVSRQTGGNIVNSKTIALSLKLQADKIPSNPSPVVIDSFTTEDANGGINPSARAVKISATVTAGSNRCMADGKEYELTQVIKGNTVHVIATVTVAKIPPHFCTADFQPAYKTLETQIMSLDGEKLVLIIDNVHAMNNNETVQHFKSDSLGFGEEYLKVK